MALRSTLLFVAATASVLGGCISPDNAAKVETALGKKCTLDSDCSAPNVCVFELCHAECASDSDCESGANCVKGEGSSASVCQLQSEKTCTKDSDCPGQQICAKDGECRDACSESSDCIAPKTCVTGSCAAPDELVDGGLPATGNEGKECHWNSDCPGDLLCINGVCGPECKTDKDCSAGKICVEGACGLPPSCGDGIKQANEACDGADVGGATCPGGAPITCNPDCTLNVVACPCTSAADCAALNDVCLAGACVNGDCVQEPANEGGACQDGDACTSGDSCVLGACLGGSPTDCTQLDGYCTMGTCDPATGCVAAPVNEGGFCDDGLVCSVAEFCRSGQCLGTPEMCPSGNACQMPACDEAAGGCGFLPANEGGMCDDGDGCTLGTTCGGGACGNATMIINQCINGDGCCPAGCPNGTDDDCVDLTGVFAEYAFDGRTVYIWKTPVPCADLTLYTTFCTDRGLAWWSPKSAADAQELITFAYNLDLYHTWIQIYGSTTTDVSGLVGGYPVIVDSPGCVDGSSSGWTAFRKWGCSFCDPENQSNASCCWDGDHMYDWFVCEG